MFKRLYGVEVAPDEFIPFLGMGEAFFLGGVAKKRGLDFDAEVAKQMFFDIYISTYAAKGGINYPGTCLSHSSVLVMISWTGGHASG